MSRLETRYARTTDGAHLAYQVVGEGDLTVVYHSGTTSHVEASWEFPPSRRVIERLRTVGRLVRFDARGTGLSDPLPTDRVMTVEDLARDVLAVMDAAGCDRVALQSELMSGPSAIWIAANAPERLSALILDSTFARYRRAPDYPFGMPDEVADAYVERLPSVWGTGATVALVEPSAGTSTEVIEEWARFERAGASPTRAQLLMRMWFQQDARSFLSKVKVPTLVYHSRDDVIVPVGHGRFLAEHIPGATYVEDEGDHAASGARLDRLVMLISEFAGGSQLRGSDALVALMFVDIAGSTERAAELGDAAWRDVLDQFRQRVRHALERFDGTEVNTRGDDFLVTFRSAESALKAADEIAARARGLALEVRCGIHIGEVASLGDDVTGLSVHIAARVAELAGSGETLVSRTVRDALLGTARTFTQRGAYALKGVPGEWQVFALEAVGSKT